MLPLPDKRSVCGSAMQNHLRKLFFDVQGTTQEDAKARVMRMENERRYQKWAETSALNATGNRPV